MSEGNVGQREVIFRIHRYDPEKKRKWVQEYRMPVYKGLTVLDALIWIKEHLDPTLSMRYSCRMGVCGSCGMLINGVPRLACQTQVLFLLEESGSNIVEVAPLAGYPVVRDLVPDLTRMIENHKRIMPYIIRKNPEETQRADHEFIMYPEQHLQIYQYTMCIMCGLCNAACPVFNSNKRYLGPQALTQAYRFIIDVRDEGADKRLAVVANADGCFACRFAASCSAVCPKAVDPAGAIQKLKHIAVAYSIGLWRKEKGSPIAGPLEKPLRQVKAEYPKHNLLPGVDPEQQAREPVSVDFRDEWLKE